MFDHVGVNVRDFERSRAFYRQALEPLGLQETMAFEEWKAGGVRPRGQVRVLGRTSASRTAPGRTSRSAATTGRRSMPSTRPRSRPGAPTTARAGIREHYHPNYYGAFVLDPDGNNIEAVCHKGRLRALWIVADEPPSGRSSGGS